jgi:predicted DNA-binding protein (MmcQ/YjbR family)
MNRSKAKRKKNGSSKRSSLPDFCRSLPGVTEDIKWRKDLVFSIGKKMFVVFDSEDLTKFAFKTTPEKYATLTAIEGVQPAPYAARFHWVAVTRAGALPIAVSKQLIGESYELVASCLPAKTRKKLGL